MTARLHNVDPLADLADARCRGYLDAKIKGQNRLFDDFNEGPAVAQPFCSNRKALPLTVVSPREIEVATGLRDARSAASRCPVLSAPAVAPPGWRNTGEPLETPTERRLGLVTDLSRDSCDLASSVGKQLRGELHAPSRKILHGRTADKTREARGKH